MPRHRKLSKAEHGLLVTRYQLYMENRPKRLARDFGIHRDTVRDYVNRAMKDGKCLSP